MNVKEVFPRKVRISEDGCWLWEGHTDRNGYSLIFRNKKTQLGHRWSFEKVNGPIPEGMEIDHKCRIRNCVNPDHLRVITRRENVRAYRDLQTECKFGHPLDGRKLDRGYQVRYCKTCHRNRTKKRT